MRAESDAKGYKFITSEMKSKNGDSGVWKVGEWKVWDGPLRMCKSGFHFSKEPVGSLDYAQYGSILCVVEWKDEGETQDTKTVCHEMRVVKMVDRDTVCRKFAIACARHVLPIYEKDYPKDERPRQAIEAAEAFLNDPSKKNRERMAAAQAAAWAAARAAARDAAQAAAWAAARAAARDAAWAAAVDAARAAEREWQNKTLMSIIDEAPPTGATLP